MTNNLYPPARPQTVGEILDTAFRIFRATLLKCLPYATLSLLAGQLPNIYGLIKSGALPQRLVVHDPLWWLLEIGGYVVALTLSSAIVRRQCAIASGQPSSAGGELSAALRLVPGFIAVSILLGLAIVASLIPALLLFAVPVLAANVGKFYAMALGGVAAVILLVPACYVGIRLSCAVTTYLLTDRGVTGSLGYSWQLTGGNVWRLSLIYTVAVVLLLVFYVLTGVIAAVVAAPFALGDVAMLTAITAALVVILGSIGTPFYTALSLAVFGDLCVRKEGSDLATRISSAPSV
jgi:hypothetical protein